MDTKSASGTVSAVIVRSSSYRRNNQQPPPVPMPAPVPSPIPALIPPPTPAPAPIPASVPAHVPSIPAAILTFIVTDNATALPVRDAAVTVDTVKIKTDEAGKAVFANISMGGHKYIVSKRGYKRITGVVRIAGERQCQ